MHGTERQCGPCPDGYLGSGAVGCEPQLLELEVSCGALTPALAAGAYNYRTRVSVLCSRLQLTATVPSGVRVDINGEPVSTESTWSSELLPVGETPVNLRLTARFGMNSLYKLVVERDGNHEAYIKASNADAQDSLGFHVAAANDTFVAGAPYEDAAAGSEPNDNRAMDSGAAYVFVRRNDAWAQEGYLKADAPSAGEYFGTNVGVSGDTIVVGAPRNNPLRFDLLPAMGTGTAYVFTRRGGTWTQDAKLVPKTSGSGDLFGMRVAIEGDTAFVSAPFDSTGQTHSGAVYVFERSAAGWTEVQRLKPMLPIADSAFGFALAIEGDTLIIGASQDPSGASKAGSAYFFERRAGMWQELQRVQASPPVQGGTFGWAAALHGTTAVISAARVNLVTQTQPGEVYIFERGAAQWEQSAVLTAAHPQQSDLYGSGVAFNGTALVVGGNGDSSGSRGANGDPTRSDAYQSGAVHVYARQGKSWELTAYLKAANADAEDGFGQVVALTNDTILVGAPFEAGPSRGINGGADMNGATSSGALYMFH
jgi:hypothetical protein